MQPQNNPNPQQERRMSPSGSPHPTGHGSTKNPNRGNNATSDDRAQQNQLSGKSQISGMTLGLIVAIAAGIFWFNQPKPLDETKSPNWSNVEEATQATTSANQEKAKRIDRSGAGTLVSNIGLTTEDINHTLTSSVQQHLSNGNPQGAADTIAEAQKIPTIPTKAKNPNGMAITPIKPSLTPGMAEGVRNGTTKFFQVFLYDSCAEDGDVVEVIIDGLPFATVPIVKSGATLSIPITTGASTTVSLRGIYDGGGGITVACKTSNGDFFMRAIQVGEVCNVGVVHQ